MQINVVICILSCSTLISYKIYTTKRKMNTRNILLSVWFVALQIIATSRAQTCPVCVCPALESTTTPVVKTTTPVVKTTTPVVKTTTPVVKTTTTAPTTTTKRQKDDSKDVSIAQKLRKLKLLKAKIFRYIRHYRMKARQQSRKGKQKGRKKDRKDRRKWKKDRDEEDND